MRAGDQSKGGVGEREGLSSWGAGGLPSGWGSPCPFPIHPLPLSSSDLREGEGKREAQFSGPEGGPGLLLSPGRKEDRLPGTAFP